MVYYCSRNCQAGHWVSGHREECKEIVDGRATIGVPSVPRVVALVGDEDFIVPLADELLSWH